MAKKKHARRSKRRRTGDEQGRNVLSTLRFRHPFSYKISSGKGGETAKTLVELQVYQLGAAIREKPDWRSKIENPEIVKRWKEEATDVTPEAFQFVLDWCRFVKSSGDAFEPSVFEHILQADGLIPSPLRDQFHQQITALEQNLEEEQKDYHPGSNNQVLDLVHPSLHCLVQGVTNVDQDPPNESAGRFDKFCGKGTPVDKLKGEGKSQWIPTDVVMQPGPKFKSYVNNLHHVEHKDLYKSLEEILGFFVPMFCQVLGGISSNKNNRTLKIIDPKDITSWYPEVEEIEDEEEFERYYKSRIPILPKVLSFAPPNNSVVYDLGDQFQVIVKVASIELDPKTSPKYEGGTWHVEGMDNEQILATGIYYYDCHNITTSRLSFRQSISEPMYEQDDDRGVKAIYGLENDNALSQYLGSFLAQPQRCLVFPNIYQHKVEPFEIEDPTKGRGWRKILVFFLIDPSRRIPSTTNIPPQQQDWWERCKPFGDILPSILVQKIAEFNGYPMTMEQAKRYREELMHERKYRRDALNSTIYERPFSLCEH